MNAIDVRNIAKKFGDSHRSYFVNSREVSFQYHESLLGGRALQQGLQAGQGGHF